MLEKDFVSNTIEQTVPTSLGNELPTALLPVETSTETDNNQNPPFSQTPVAATEESANNTTPVPQYSQSSIAIGSGYVIPVQVDSEDPWLEIVREKAQNIPPKIA